MFVEHEVDVALSIDVLEHALIDHLSAVEGLGEVVYRNGEELRSRVGPETQLAKEVVLKFGQPRISRSGLAVPVTWRATAARVLFPRLTGELEAFRNSPTGSTLRLRGSYDPPFGWVGDALDHLLLERVARLTIADWLQRIGDSLEQEASKAQSE